jgi:dynein heavy chain
VSRLRATAAVVSALKKAYFAAKVRASAEVPHRPWRIANGALFGRLDAFLGQLHDVGEMAAAAMAYSKLEKLVVGGDRGQALCTAMEGLHADYRAALGALEAAPYDLLLEVDAARFAADMAEWRAQARALDRRLAATLRTALDDAPNVYARFKLLDSFDALLERAAVQVSGWASGRVGGWSGVCWGVAAS